MEMKKHCPVIDTVKTGRNIKRIMQEKGLSVKDIRSFLELGSSQSVYHWLEGKSLPTVDNLYALSDILGLPVDALLCGNRKAVYASFPIDNRARHIYAYYERIYKKQAG